MLPEPSRRVIHWYYMATRTVRLDEESERALADVRRATGTSVSGALKRGLVAARDALRSESSGISGSQVLEATATPRVASLSGR